MSGDNLAVDLLYNSVAINMCLLKECTDIEDDLQDR